LCCDNPQQELPHLCLSGTPRPPSTVSLELHTHKTSGVDEAQRAASVNGLPMQHVRTHVSHRPEGCGELCASRTLLLQFDNAAALSAFLGALVADASVHNAFFATHRVATLKLLASSSLQTPAILELLDALVDAHMGVHAGAEFLYSFPQIDGASFDKAC